MFFVEKVIRQEKDMGELVVRSAENRDLDRIYELEKECFAMPWSYESLKYDLFENRLALYLVAELDGVVCGYIGIWNVAGEGHITNVAVSKDYRRRGIADTMLEIMLEACENLGVETFTLEARESNVGAIHLYKQHGFESWGYRPGYYSDNNEDALIMWRGRKKDED